MNLKMLKAAVAGLVLSVSGFANAGLIINISELLGNVEVSYSGTINLNATQGFSGTSGGYNGYLADFGAISITNSLTDYYSIDVSTWTPFGSGSFGNWDVSNGNALALFSNPVLGLESGYISEGFLSGTATKFGASFASLGFDTGSYLTTLTNGNITDTVRINVGQQVSVPEPSTLAIFTLGIMGLASRRCKK